MNLRAAGSARIFLYVGAAIFCLCVCAFFEIAEDFPEGQFATIDDSVLRCFRHTGDLAIPRGPGWLKDAMRDTSALGSAPILGITVVGVVGYLLLARRWHESLVISAASAGGWVLNVVLKALADRPRPTVVPHLADVSSSSFPSGHSMLSAIVYLSLGAMISRSARSHGTALYVLGLAIFLTLMVGLTRVYLGVHYPTDVVAGWAAGTAWALLCVAAQSTWKARGPRLQLAHGKTFLPHQ